MKKHFIFWLLSVWLGLFANTSYAVTVTKVQDLNFGKLVAGSGGTVTITASNGNRSSTGGVLLINSTANRARFTITFAPLELLLKTSVTYTVSPDPTTLNGNNGGNVTVTTYTGNPNPFGVNLVANILALLLGQSYDFFVGGTLTVNAGETPGIYTNNITVTVTVQ